MKKILSKIIKSIIFGLIAVVLVTLGIDASDHYDNLSQSIIGRTLFGEDTGPCTKDMVFVPSEKGGFCIDKYEASPGSECPEKTINNQSQTLVNINDVNCLPVSESGQMPWRFISQNQAAVACAKAGKRLPSDEEWYLASLGTPDKNEQWGKEDCQVAKNWPEQPGLSGSAKNCVSAYGAYDMIGNVWEWVKGEIKDGKFNGNKLPGDGYIKGVSSRGIPIETIVQEGDPNFNNDYLWIKNSGIRGMARGGYWDNDAEAGLYAMYLVSPTYFSGTGVGFRCAK